MLKRIPLCYLYTIPIQVFLIFLLLVVIFDDLGRPHKQPADESQQPASYGEGTKDSPLVVQLTEAPETEGIAEESGNQPEPESWRDWFSTLSIEEITAFFLGLQILVFGWQGIQLLLTVNTMRMAERAYMKISHMPPGLDIRSDGQIAIAVQVLNLGRTPGTIEGVYLHLLHVRGGEGLPRRPDYSDVAKYATTDYVMGAGADDHLLQSRVAPFGVEFVPAVRRGEATLWLYGYVDYRDIFGKPFRAGYGRRYDPRQDVRVNFPTDQAFEIRNNLVILGQGGYNFDRPRWRDEAGHPDG